MKRLLIAVAAVAALAGCANTQEYQAYVAAHQARAAAEVARYNALAEIGKSGDTTSRVAAAIILQQGGQGGQAGSNIAPPTSAAEVALRWTSLLLPSLTQFYSINKNASVAITQSNNAASVARSTNEAFVGIAGQIQAPVPNVTVGGNYNVGSNSGNEGKIAGNDLIDSTSAPYVVDPVIVNQPAPVIVQPSYPPAVVTP